MRKALAMFGLVLTLALPASHADELTDAALAEGKQFLAATSVPEQWDGSPQSYAKAWEQAMGLSGLIWLRYEGALPHPWIRQVNARLASLRKLGMREVPSPEAGQLAAMVGLYAEYAQLFMMGQVKYGDYVPVRHYLPSGQWLAERVRGKAYEESRCTWAANDCKPALPVWAQR